MDYKLQEFEKYSDQRGDLIVFLKKSELKKTTFGQIYFVTFNDKSKIRGNHYHKKWREWFGVVSGKVEILLEDVKTKERKTLILSGADKKYVRLETGPYIAHAFKSITKKAVLLNYASGEWSKEDSFKYKLL